MDVNKSDPLCRRANFDISRDIFHGYDINVLAYSHPRLVCNLQRVQAALHDLRVFDLALGREEIFERGPDHDPVTG